jgi:glutathione S-transferase
MFRILDDALAGGPYLLGQRFSAADIFLTMMARWSRNMAKPAVTYPNIKRNVDLVVARPAIQRAYKAEGLS